MNDDRQVANPLSPNLNLNISISPIEIQCEQYAKFIRDSYDSAKSSNLSLAQSIQKSVWRYLRGI